MTELDTKFSDTALTLINRFGKVVTFKVIASSVYDRSTGENVETIVNYSATVSPPTPMKLEYSSGADVQIGDTLVYLAAKNLVFTPDLKQEITIDAKDWTIVGVMPLYSGNSICAYGLHLRN